MLPLLILAVVLLALAAGFAAGLMVGLARRPPQAVPRQEPVSACRYPGPPLEPAQQPLPARVR
jgi:hypothetical protein